MSKGRTAIVTVGYGRILVAAGLLSAAAMPFLQGCQAKEEKAAAAAPTVETLSGSEEAVLTSPPQVPPPPTVELAHPAERLWASDVRLVLVDATGLEWQRSERVQSPPGASARLTAVMAALREALLAEGVWPEALPAPRAFMETIERRSVAVVDLRPPPDLGVSVAQERAIQRAIQGTAELAGAQAVVFLRHGAPAETLLGHVAVPSAL